MRINYNVTGERRKSLAVAISQELNTPIKYLFAPSFAYEVGGYHIDKTGILIGEDNPDLVADLQGLYDFKAVNEEYDTPLPQAAPVPDDIPIPHEASLGCRVSPYRDEDEPPAYGMPEKTDTMKPISLTLELPRSTFTDTALENLKRLVDSKASLIKKALDVTELRLEVSEDIVRFLRFQESNGRC